MKIVIGIPTYNGGERLDALLTSIALRTPLISGGDVGIVLVDDGSPRVKETRAVADRWTGKLPLMYVEHATNRGISAGWNTASRATDAPIIALVNDDVIVPSGGWLEALVHVLEHSPGVGVVGANWHAFTPEDVPRLLAGPETDRDVVPRDPGTKQPTPERRSYEDTGLGGSCARRDNSSRSPRRFDAIGGFDEAYQSFYEESRSGHRWRRAASSWSAADVAVLLSSVVCDVRGQPSTPGRAAHGRVAAHYRAKWGVPGRRNRSSTTRTRSTWALSVTSRSVPGSRWGSSNASY